jgi:hypothetical protein
LPVGLRQGCLGRAALLLGLLSREFWKGDGSYSLAQLSAQCQWLVDHQGSFSIPGSEQQQQQCAGWRWWHLGLCLLCCCPRAAAIFVCRCLLLAYCLPACLPCSADVPELVESFEQAAAQ